MATGILRRWVFGLLSSSLVALAPSAHAQWYQGNWYLGGGLGYMSAEPAVSRFSAVNIPCTPRPCGYSTDADSSALSLFGGWEVSDQFAIELAYQVLPDTYKVRLNDPNFPPPAMVSVEQDTRAITLRGVYTVPLSRFFEPSYLAPFSVSAVFGIDHWTSEASVHVDLRGAGGPQSSTSTENSGLGLMAGARVNYAFNPQITLSAAWEHHLEVGDSSHAIVATFPAQVQPVENDVDVFSLLVTFRF